MANSSMGSDQPLVAEDGRVEIRWGQEDEFGASRYGPTAVVGLDGLNQLSERDIRLLDLGLKSDDGYKMIKEWLKKQYFIHSLDGKLK